MSNPYPGTSVTGYNANPPPDDGSQISTNEITWAGIKTKLGDPLDTFASSVDSNLTSAFAKLVDGSPVVSTATSYAAGAADQGKLIEATASGITITTPDATVVNSPFVFAITNQSTGTITLAGGGSPAQDVDGSTSVVVQAGGSCLVKTDGSNWFTIGGKPAELSLGGNNYGFGPAVNLQLKASVASSLLTVAVKTKAGNDPSAGDPVLIPFRDATLANGDPVWLTITSALSINTNATGATLGTQNSKPFRLWVLMFNNAGTPELAFWHSGAGAASIAINPLNEGTVQSTTGISSGATSAGVFYTPNGVTLTNCAFRILGYVEYISGLTTAGTYSAAPDIVQLFGPGIKKPGDIVQTQYMTSTSGQSANATTTITAVTMAITPTSSANLIKAACYASGELNGVNNSSGAMYSQIARSSAATSPSNLFGTKTNASNANSVSPGSTSSGNGMVMAGIDAPATTSATTYSVYIWKTGSGNGVWLGDAGGGSNAEATFFLEEIMA